MVISVKREFSRPFFLAFMFYALGYGMRGVVRLYNPGTFWGDMVTDAVMFIGVFLLGWGLYSRFDRRAR